MFRHFSGLGGTYVQHCFVCLFRRIFMCRIFLYILKKQFNSSLLSDQHHAGLQPANLVTYSLRSCSRRRSDLFIRLFFTSFLRFIQYFVFFRPFTTELQYRLHTLVTYRTRYFRTLNPTWRTVRTCSCPISMPDLQYAFDISYVPYEIIDLNSQSIKVHH